MLIRVQHLGAILPCMGGMGCLSSCRAITALGHHGTAARNTQEQTLKEGGEQAREPESIGFLCSQSHKGLSHHFHLHLRKQP